MKKYSYAVAFLALIATSAFAGGSQSNAEKGIDNNTSNQGAGSMTNSAGHHTDGTGTHDAAGTAGSSDTGKVNSTDNTNRKNTTPKTKTKGVTGTGTSTGTSDPAPTVK